MEEKKNVSFKDNLKISLWSFKFLYDIFPKETVLFLIFSILRGVDSLIYVFIFGKTIDAAIALSKTPESSITSIIPLLLLFLSYLIISSIINTIRGFYTSKFRYYSQRYIHRKDYYRIKELGLQELERPETLDKIDLVSQWSSRIPDLYMAFCDVVTNTFSLLATGFVLLRYTPVLLVIILIWKIISYIPIKGIRKKDWEYQIKKLQESRMAASNSRILTGKDSLKEVAITGSFEYLDKKYVGFFKHFLAYLFDLRKRWQLISGTLESIDKVLEVVGYGIVIIQTIQNKITIGETTFAISSVRNFGNAVDRINISFQSISNLTMKLRDVYDFYNDEVSFVEGSQKMPRLGGGPSIEIKGLTFKYPNTKDPLFKNFNLNIKPNEKIAIVGENGAGKSSLIKLLIRLYEPDKGSILVNDKLLKEYKIDDWYKNIGVLFQEYNFYEHLTAEENIFLGKPKKKIDRDKIVEAAKQADAHDFIKKYPKKYKTIMSEKYDGGIKPSKGQTQKIGIARLFYRNPPLVIFDEPTASIDAISEYKIFNRIYDFFENKTVIIISHRFSTVRNADRIIVLDKGKIIEEGSHEELMKFNGKYAESFTKQAEGYN